MSLRVGVDIDGPLYDLGLACQMWKAVATGRPATDFPLDDRKYAFYEAWGHTRDEFKALVLEGMRAGHIFHTGEPRAGAVAALMRIKAAGHEIHVVTARASEGAEADRHRDGFGDPDLLRQATIDWLDFIALEYDSVSFSDDKTSVPTDWFIEDLIANYDALEAAGTRAVLIETPWNQVEGGDHRLRVPDMDTFASLVLGEAKILVASRDETFVNEDGSKAFIPKGARMIVPAAAKVEIPGLVVL